MIKIEAKGWDKIGIGFSGAISLFQIPSFREEQFKWNTAPPFY